MNLRSSHFHPVALHHASRLINHGPTVLVTSAHDNKRNVMAAAWSMPVNFEPPRIAVVIDASTYTKDLVCASGAFGICIPGAGMIDTVYGVGNTSGRDTDKFVKYAINAFAGSTCGVPLIEQGCAAWLECRLLAEPRTQSAYDTFFGEVIAAAADTRIFSNGRWLLNNEHADLHTIHHLGGGSFITAGNVLRARHNEIKS
ncbi:MAG TPA: flavin reductase family protein [Burkholderiaceae bacterium]|nr:flavin reductase family protein [Burkholderiaceae bacterium]